MTARRRPTFWPSACLIVFVMSPLSGTADGERVTDHLRHDLAQRPSNDPPDNTGENFGPAGEWEYRPSYVGRTVAELTRVVEPVDDPSRSPEDISEFLAGAFPGQRSIGFPEFRTTPRIFGGIPGRARTEFSGAKGSAKRTVHSVTRVQARSAAVSRPRSVCDSFDSEGQPQLVLDYQGFVGAVVSRVAFSPDDRYLAAAGDVVRIWDLRTGELAHTLRGQREFGGAGSCTDLAYSADGKHLLVSVDTYDASLRVYNTADFSEITEVLGGHDGQVDRVALSREGRWLATAGADGEIHIWDWPSRTKVATVVVEYRIDYLGFPGEAAHLLAIDVKGNYLYWKTPRDTEQGGTVIAPSPDAPEEAGTVLVGERCESLEALLPADGTWPGDGAVHPFALGLDLEKGWLLAGGLNKKAGKTNYWCGLWPSAGARPQALLQHDYFVTACAMSNHGKWAATADGLGRIHVWDVALSERKHLFAPRCNPVYAVQFEGDQNHLSFGCTPYALPRWKWNHYGDLDRQFNFSERRMRRRSPEPAPCLVRWNGMRLSLRKHGDVPWLSVHEGSRLVSSCPCHGATVITPVSYRFLKGTSAGFANGIVISDEQGEFGLLHPRDLLPRRIFHGHLDRVWCVSESPDGRLLASGSGDGTVRLWSFTNLQKWGDLAALADGNGRIYHVTPGSPTERAGIRKGDRIIALGQSLMSPSSPAVPPPPPVVEPPPGLRVPDPPPEREPNSTPQNHVVIAETDAVERTGNATGRYSLGRLASKWLARGKWPFQAEETVTVTFVRDDEIHELDVELSNTGDLSEPLLSIFTWDEGGQCHWVIWTQQGYYDASPGADRFIGWHQNRGRTRAAEYYPASNLHPVFYQPELIDRVLELGDVERAIEEVKPPAPWVKQLPVVQILEPNDETETVASTILLRADIQSFAVPLREVRVLVNGRAFRARNIKGVRVEGRLRPQSHQLNGADFAEAEHLSEYHWRISEEVRLSEGENRIGVIGITDKGTSPPREVIVRCRRPDDRPNLFVAAIGVSDYRDAQLDLKFAHRDAMAFADVWTSQRGLLYRDVFSNVVINEQATRDGVLGAMRWLYDRPRKNDVAILFVSGHGFADVHGEYFFAVHEVDANRLFETGLPWSRFQDYFMRVPCKTLVFVDTCRAAGVVGAGSAVRNPVMHLSREENGVIVFAAGSHRKPSLELDDHQQGAFTEAILRTLADATSDLTPADGFLSDIELAHGIKWRTEQLTGMQQQPRFHKPVTVPDFDVFKLAPKDP